MSFDTNLSLSRNLSNIQASAKSQDGGAGNTGYFMREEQDENVGLRFKDTGIDFFDKSKPIEKEDDDIDLLAMFLRFIEKLIDKIKKLFSH